MLKFRAAESNMANPILATRMADKYFILVGLQGMSPMIHPLVQPTPSDPLIGYLGAAAAKANFVPLCEFRRSAAKVDYCSSKPD